MLKGLCQPGRPVFSSRGLAWHRGAAAGVPRPHSRRRRRGDIITSRLTSPLVARRVCLLLAHIGVDVLRLHRENRKTPEVSPRNCRRWLRRAPLQSRRPNRLQRACACARCAVRVHTQCSDTVCRRGERAAQGKATPSERGSSPRNPSRAHVIIGAGSCTRTCSLAWLAPERLKMPPMPPSGRPPPAAVGAAAGGVLLGSPDTNRAGWWSAQPIPHKAKSASSKALPRRGAARGFCTRRSLDR